LSEVSHDWLLFVCVIFAVSDEQNPRNSTLESAQHTDHVTLTLTLMLAAFQALSPAVLTVITGLVLLLGTQDCVPANLSCTPLVYLDVASSLMAAIVLMSKAVPVVRLCA